MTLREIESATPLRDVDTDTDTEERGRTLVNSLEVNSLGSQRAISRSQRRYPAYIDRIRPLRGIAGSCRLPRQNALLAALPPSDYQRICTVLEPVVLRRGSTIYRAGDQAKYLYFPTAGIVARYHLMQDGAATAVAVTGNDGVIGMASFLGDTALHGEAMALSDGHAYRLRGNLVDLERDHHRELARFLLRYTQVLMAQIGQVAACTGRHSLEQQLCRWILTCTDQLHSNELVMTHELIARMLGVRREGVTRAASAIRGAGLVDYGRNHIVVLDRHALEVRACECYGCIAAASARLRACTAARRTMTDINLR